MPGMAAVSAARVPGSHAGVVRLARFALWSGTPGYLDIGDLVFGGHGYLDSGIELGRAGLYFAGASIVFIWSALPASLRG